MPRGHDDGPTTQIALPRLTPAVKAMLIGLLALFVAQLIYERWLFVNKPTLVAHLAVIPRSVARGQLWRMVTYPLVQPIDITSLMYGALGLYFFGGPLEEQWGTRRFLFFSFLVVLLSGLVATLYGFVHPVFYTQPVYGVAPVSYAMTAAWGTRFPNARLLFPPVSGKVLVWIILGIALLMVLARSQEVSPAASVGAIGIGWVLARYWDRIEDWLDRRELKRLRAKKERTLRGLHVVTDDRPKKDRPIDKRYLN